MKPEMQREAAPPPPIIPIDEICAAIGKALPIATARLKLFPRDMQLTRKHREQIVTKSRLFINRGSPYLLGLQATTENTPIRFTYAFIEGLAKEFLRVFGLRVPSEQDGCQVLLRFLERQLRPKDGRRT